MTIILKFFQIRIDKLYGGPLTISPFFVFYYTVQEYLFQTTIGKLPFRLKVVSTKSNAFIDKEAGSNPTFFQILIRSLTRLLFVNNVKIGKNVAISNSIIGDNVTIGDGTKVGQTGFGFAFNRKSQTNDNYSK